VPDKEPVVKKIGLRSAAAAKSLGDKRVQVAPEQAPYARLFGAAGASLLLRNHRTILIK
jgi:hypothetical protein